MRTTIRLSKVAVLLAAFLIAPLAARAQLAHGVAGGLSLAGPSPSINAFAETYRPGFTARVFIGTQTSRRLAAGVEASITRFSMRHASHFVWATGGSPECWSLCPVGITNAPVGVAALTVNGVMTLNALNRGGQMYLIAGIGPYFIYQHPDARGAMRLGALAGAGWVIPGRGRSRLFIEARYQQLVGSPAQLSWMAPVTVGVRF
jgi:hypothetical protein